MDYMQGFSKVVQRNLRTSVSEDQDLDSEQVWFSTLIIMVYFRRHEENHDILWLEKRK